MLARYFSVFVVFVLRVVVAQDLCDDPNACDEDFACFCPQCANTINCLICGYQGSEPQRCVAFNSTFDDLAAKSVIGTYYQATWSPLKVVTHNADNPILPSSSKNMARSTTGTAVLAYVDGPQIVADNIGGLYGFDFACADPCTKTSSKAATSCFLNVTASCVHTYWNGYEPEAYEYSNNYTYIAPATGLRKAPMTTVLWSQTPGEISSSPDDGYYDPMYCFNYTFVATMADGKTPFLYLDNVIGNYYYELD